MNKEDFLTIVLIIVGVGIMLFAVYMGLRVNMGLAEHYGLDGWDYWWYVIGNHGG